MTDFFKDISAFTRLYALIGSPVQHSLSPRIHNYSFRAIGFNALYLAFDVKDLAAAVAALQTLDAGGFNVTVPYKQKIMPLLDDLSSEARSIGSVNTVVRKDAQWIGYNTDAVGFSKTLEPLREEIKNQNVRVIGAGGGARAVVYALLTGFDVQSITICNRTPARALQLISDLKDLNTGVTLRMAAPDQNRIDDVKLVIQASSVGLNSGEDLAAPVFFNDAMIAYDLIYFETPFLRQARTAGARCINGLGMLIEQAATAFKIWTGREMPTGEVIKYLYEKVDNH